AKASFARFFSCNHSHVSALRSPACNEAGFTLEDGTRAIGRTGVRGGRVEGGSGTLLDSENPQKPQNLCPSSFLCKHAGQISPLGRSSPSNARSSESSSSEKSSFLLR